MDNSNGKTNSTMVWSISMDWNEEAQWFQLILMHKEEISWDLKASSYASLINQDGGLMLKYILAVEVNGIMWPNLEI